MKGRRVFYSYAHQDYLAVEQISVFTKDATDVVWIDRRIIQPGDIWRDEINKALKRCYYVLFFASNSSINSDEVKKEIGYALYLKKKVIPVLLEKCDLPYEVNNIHYIDLSERDEHQMDILRQTLAGISTKQKAKPANDRTAAAIVKDVKTANSFYNTMVVPYKNVWFSTLAMVCLLVVSVFLINNNQYKYPIDSDGAGVPDTSVSSSDTSSVMPLDSTSVDSISK